MRGILARGLVSAVLLLVTAARAGVPLTLTPLPPIEQNVGEDALVQSLALADLDGDGVLDMVVIDIDSDEVWAYIGRGDGTFAEGTFIGVADLPTAVAVADVTSPFETGGDVDGLADVIVVDELGGLHIFIGRGDGTFDPPDQIFEDIDATELVGVVVADFDGDGRGDLALLESFDGVYFLCNDRGTLVPCPTPGVLLDELASQLVGIVAGDFLGGGHIDIAVIDTDLAEVYVIRGNGDGTFDAEVEPVAVGPPGVEPIAVLTLPAAAGGPQSIAVLSVDELLEDPLAVVSVLTADPGSGQFAQRDYAAGDIANAFAAADFDGDGQVDIVVVGEDTIDEIVASVFLGGSAAGFLPPLSLAGDDFPGGRVVAAGDLDGDGRPDLVSVIDAGTRILALLNGGGPPPACVGDCDGNGVVGINELIRGVNIALALADLATCTAMDRNGDGRVVISELVAAVNNALAGCVA